MSTIDPRQAVTAALREQLAAQRSHVRPGAAAALARTEPRSVSTTLALRIASLAPTDPDRGRKAVRLFLESQIAAELGEPLLNDPQFPRMVDTIQAQMQADAQTAAAVDALGAWLLAGGAQVRPR